MSESKVDIIVSGRKDFDPDNLTVCIDIQPDIIWRIGDKVGGSLIERKENAWVISSALAAVKDVSELLEMVLRRISPVKEAMRSYIASRDDVDMQASIVMYISDDVPAFCVEPDIVSDLSYFGASIDIDIIPVD